jgi:hypothetical protein
MLHHRCSSALGACPGYDESGDESVSQGIGIIPSSLTFDVRATPNLSCRRKSVSTSFPGSNSEDVDGEPSPAMTMPSGR